MEKDNENISLKKIIIYYINHWRLFALAAVISLVPALLYLFLTPKTYDIMTKIELRDNNNMASSSGFNIGDASGLMKSFGLGGISSGTLNIDDEEAKLTSNSLLKQMVLQLGLDVTYYKPYVFDYKLYEDIPFLLTTDLETKEQLDCSVKFQVKIDEKGAVTVKTKARKKKNTFHFESLPAIISLPQGDFVLSYREKPEYPLSMDIKIQPAGWVAETLAEDILFDTYSENSNVLEISYSDYERQRGKDMLNTLVSVYNHQEDSVKRVESEKSISFLDGRIQSVMSDLSDIEMKIETYKLQHKMTDIEYDVQFYVEQLKELETNIIELEARVHVIDLMVEYIQDPENKYNLLPSLLSSGEGEKGGPITTYNEALLERAKLLQSSKKNNPLINQATEQVDKLRNSVYLSIENTKKGILLTLEDLKRKEDVIIAKMGTVPTLERSYIDFKRQQEISQAVYLILLQQREDLALSIGEKKERARIIESAYVKQIPVGPRKLYAAIIMMLLTVCLPVLYLFAKTHIEELIVEYKKSK